MHSAWGDRITIKTMPSIPMGTGWFNAETDWLSWHGGERICDLFDGTHVPGGRQIMANRILLKLAIRKGGNQWQERKRAARRAATMESLDAVARWGRKAIPASAKRRAS